MKIPRRRLLEEELIHLCNKELNIKDDECHVNAFLILQKIGQMSCKIIIGQASYIDLDGNENIVKNHLWNEYHYNYEDNPQLIDASNYLKGGKIFFNHKGVEFEFFNYLDDKMKEVQRLIENGNNDKLIMYENDNIPTHNK